jgi:hypothetical protein
LSEQIFRIDNWSVCPADHWSTSQLLPGEPGFFATVALQIISTKLNASLGASEPHDFAVRAGNFRQSQPSRPPHPTATFVTIAGRPSFGSGGFVVLICPTAEAEYFRSKTG